MNNHLTARALTAVVVMFCISCTTATTTVQSDPANNKVRIMLTTTSSYCGGARPPEEMLAELATPKPLEENIYIRQGTINDVRSPVVASGRTGADGTAEISLSPGNYVLVFANKMDSRQYDEWLNAYREKTSNHDAIDKSCLDKWLSTPELAFNVKDTDITYSCNRHITCPWQQVPCAEYTGPLPP